jgi:hypothetical protein
LLRLWVVCTVVWISYQAFIWGSCRPTFDITGRHMWCPGPDSDMGSYWLYTVPDFLWALAKPLVGVPVAALAAIYIGSWITAGFRRHT